MSATEDLCAAFMRELNKNPEYQAALLQPFRDIPIDLRIELALVLIKKFEILPKFLFTSSKSNIESNRYRKLGDLAYKLSNYAGALKYYTKSVSFALKDSEELALAFSNRSAVLFRLEKYFYALIEINRALKETLSEKIRKKLHARKHDCIKALQLQNASRLVVADTMLSATNVDEGTQYFYALAYLLALQFDENVTDPATETKARPPVLKKINPLIPDASNKIKVAYSVEKGRYLVATKKIEPGETIISEKSYASVLLPDRMHTHCACCYLRSMILIPCSDCSKVMFCSEKCRNEALNQFHRVECQILPSLLKAQCGEREILAVRMLLIATNQGQDLKRFLRSETFKQPFAGRKTSVNEKYFSKSYLTVINLFDGYQKLQETDSILAFVVDTVISAYLLDFLNKSTIFVGAIKKSNQIHAEIPRKIELLIGSLLLKNLLVLKFNSEEVTEWITGSSISSDDPQVLAEPFRIGKALYPLFSLANHSCDPNVVKSYHRDFIVVRAIQPIAAGEEISNCYGFSFGVHPVRERQEYLERYAFECTCDPCKFNWPLYDNLPVVNPEYLPTRVDQSTLDRYAEQWRKQIHNEEVIVNYEEFIRKYLSILHKSIKKPWKEYYYCAEILRILMLKDGNIYSRDIDIVL